MSAKERYQAGQDALFALLPQGILDTEAGRQYYNQQADKLVEDFLKEQGKDGEQYFCGLCGCLMPLSHFPH
jgi:hypothetical protein